MTAKKRKGKFRPGMRKPKADEPLTLEQWKLKQAAKVAEQKENRNGK
jgi:hypothetical protein